MGSTGLIEIIRALHKTEVHNTAVTHANKLQIEVPLQVYNVQAICLEFIQLQRDEINNFYNVRYCKHNIPIHRPKQYKQLRNGGQ